MARYSTLSDERGEYHIVGLPVGRLRAHGRAAGLPHVPPVGHRLCDLADRTSLDVKLEVGQPSQSVDVTAAAPLLQTASGEVSLNVGEKDHDPAAGRAQLHSAGYAVAGRGAAERPVSAAHQRQPPAHERVHLRRHQRAAAGARPGGLLPDHRRHGRVQAQRQRLLSRVRPVERRHRHGDRKIRKQPVPRKPLRVLPQRGAECAEPVRAAGTEAGVPPQSVRR